jgi:DNA mismatch repair protein MutL
MNTELSPGRIHILDPATVNQIAAGEVVERPASVIKELVENAIDADAHAIRIDLKSAQGTITRLQVTDDGRGMSPEDAILAFTPHATSKILTIDDLHTIHTLGFRGEALASIAAVSAVTLVTKLRGSGSVAGTRVVVNGGQIDEQSETGAPDGTTVVVESLFFNTPVRKKFQKSLNTELTHIHTILEGICLSHPEISFRFSHNSREQLVTDRTTQPLDTIAQLFGSDETISLIPVSASFPFMNVSGYISPPAQSRKDARRLLITINHRFVTSPVITNAIKEGYGTLLPRDRFPLAYLFLDIDTDRVDVNVHPTKKQVRLSHEAEIADALRGTISTILLKHDLIPECDLSQPLIIPDAVPDTRQKAAMVYATEELPLIGIRETTHYGTVMTDRQLRQTELPTGIHSPLATIPKMTVIGQFGGIYILATTTTGELLIIDQHAAHERILYEQVTSQSQAKKQSQELLVPVILKRSPRDASILRELIPDLLKEGVIIEEFGIDTFLVRALPVILGNDNGTAYIDELTSDLLNRDPTRSVSDRERITRVIACRGAIKAGTVCTHEQCQRIVDQVRLTKSPFTCPHGRPTIIRFSKKQLDEMFQRT